MILTRMGLAAAWLATALLATGCAAPAPRDFAAELAASPPRAASAGYDAAYSAVVHAAMDAGYTPALVNREGGEFGAWMVGKLDSEKTAKVVAGNVGMAAAAAAVILGSITLAMLSGGHGSTPNFDNWHAANDDVSVHLLVSIEKEAGHAANIRVLTAAPGSEKLEPGLTDDFWVAVSRHTAISPAPVARVGPAAAGVAVSSAKPDGPGPPAARTARSGPMYE